MALSKAYNAYSALAGYVCNALSGTVEQDYSPKMLTATLRAEGLLSSDEEVVSVDIENLSGRGFVGSMYEVKVKCSNGSEHLLIVKTCSGPQAYTFSRNIRGCREGFFYNTFGRTTCKDFAVPSLYAYANSYTGKYTILMHDMRKGNVGVNLLLGNQIWGLPEDFDRSKYMSEEDVLKKIFVTAGRFHATSWNSEVLKDVSWLGCNDVLHGKGRVWWELAVQRAKDVWKNRRPSVKHSDRVVKVVDASLAASTFDNAVTGVQGGPLALCHGDWHASNMFLGDDGDLRLCDWCDVSVWNPVRDIAQFIVSDVKIKEHGDKFPDLLRAYYQALQDNGADLKEYSFEACWKDFLLYGLSRWVYFIAILHGMAAVPDSLLEYFDRQMVDFLEAHCKEDDTTFPIMTVVGFY